MNAPVLSAHAPAWSSLSARSRMVVWGAILLSTLVCAMVAWLHAQERQTLRTALRELENIRQARIDLGQGFLNISLASSTEMPFGRAEGLALLRQAVSSFEQALAELGDVDQGATRDFAHSVAVFETLLEQWQKEGMSQPGKTVALRVAFNQLERQSDEIDTRIQRRLLEHSERLDMRFALALGLAALLLALICGVVFMAGRARDELEATLLESEQRFRLAMEATSDGLWDWDVPSNRTYYSPAYWRMLGYQPGEFEGSGRAWVDLIHPDDRQRVLAANQDCIDNPGQGLEIEFRMRAKNESWLWVLGRAQAISRDERGRALRLIGTHLDISQRKLGQEALRQSQDAVQGLLDATTDAILLLDRDYLILAANEVAARRLGLSQASVGGRNILDLMPPQAAQVIRARLEEVLASRRPLRFKEQSQGLHLDNHFYPITNPRAEVTAVALYARDITQAVEDEQKRASLERQLQQAQKMEAIGKLAGGIAHDFNNILGVILGFSEMALDDARQGRGNPRDLEQVIQAGERAKALVTQILTFSRKVEVEMKPLSLNREVAQAAQLLGKTIPRMIRIELDLAPDLEDISANANQLEQILLNLGANSADAMPQGGRLIFKTENLVARGRPCLACGQEFSGPFVALSVSDTGQGMDQQTMEHIFEPFYTTKGPGKGTGLGLSTVYGITKGHGGHITCQSAPGAGTAFTFYFPVGSGPEPSPALARPVSSGPGGQESILLVDDEEGFLRLETRVLREAGYQVRQAATGEEALAAFRAHAGEVDLLILDLDMPGMGGERAWERVVALAPQVRVIVASGHVLDERLQAVLASGTGGYLAKPFRREELLTMVRNVLDKK
ncbi:MAG: PAS domain-containing protein [Pseudomonadota bacterium]